MFDIKKIGVNIRFYRKRAGLTQIELAERLHVSFQAVSGWECGASLPDLENLCHIANLFDVSVDTLLSVNLLSDEHVMIGVDGGGTKTEFVLFTSAGHVLKRVVLSGSNEALVGVETAISILQEGIDRCLDVFSNVIGVFIGIAGGKHAELRRALHKHYPGVRFFIESDACNAFASARGDVALICGTGSILMYRADGGEYAFKGGWGYSMGDPGSAYNIGREAIRAALACEDGMRAESVLYSLLKEKLETGSIHRSFFSLSVPEIASLSTVVFAAYRMEDAVAKEILENEMRSLSLFIKSACAVAGKRVIACGGIMEHHFGTLYPMLQKYVSSDITFILPKLPPVYGACSECAVRMGFSIHEEFEARFTRDYSPLKTN